MRRGADRPPIKPQADTSGPGVVTLGQVAPRLAMLEVTCNRCDRRGRLATAQLLAEHGADLPMPELPRVVAVDCPQDAVHRSGITFPFLITYYPQPV